jgi:hypothetical protein
MAYECVNHRARGRHEGIAPVRCGGKYRPRTPPCPHRARRARRRLHPTGPAPRRNCRGSAGESTYPRTRSAEPVAGLLQPGRAATPPPASTGRRRYLRLARTLALDRRGHPRIRPAASPAKVGSCVSRRQILCFRRSNMCFSHNLTTGWGFTGRIRPGGAVMSAGGSSRVDGRGVRSSAHDRRGPRGSSGEGRGTGYGHGLLPQPPDDSEKYSHAHRHLWVLTAWFRVVHRQPLQNVQMPPFERVHVHPDRVCAGATAVAYAQPAKPALRSTQDTKPMTPARHSFQRRVALLVPSMRSARPNE